MKNSTKSRTINGFQRGGSGFMRLGVKITQGVIKWRDIRGGGAAAGLKKHAGITSHSKCCKMSSIIFKSNRFRCSRVTKAETPRSQGPRCRPEVIKERLNCL